MEEEAIKFLTELISNHRKVGLSNIPNDCNNFGSSGLNEIYKEVFSTCENKEFVLCIAGSGMFLEDFINEVWVRKKLQRQQLESPFQSWDEMMSFLDKQYLKLDKQGEVQYKKDIRPVLLQVLEESDVKHIELVHAFARNIFIHSKRSSFIKLLQEHGVLPSVVPLKKMTFERNIALPGKEEFVYLSPSHPLIKSVGFKVLAEQLAPALLIFIYHIFEKYHKDLRPLRDDHINIGGNEK